MNLEFYDWEPGDGPDPIEAVNSVAQAEAILAAVSRAMQPPHRTGAHLYSEESRRVVKRWAVDPEGVVPLAEG